MAQIWPLKSHTWGLGIAIIVVVLVGLLSHRDLKQYLEERSVALEARQASDHANALLSALKDAETGQRGYLLTGKSEYLDAYRAALPLIERHLAPLESSPTVKHLPAGTGDLRPLVRDKLNELEQTVLLRASGQPARALSIVETDRGLALMDRIRTLCGLINRSALKQVAASSESAGALAVRTRMILIFGTGLITLILVFSTAYVEKLVRTRERMISALQTARDVAETRKDTLQTTLRSIGDAVITTDQKARVVFLNPVAEQLTGWSSDEAQGRPLPDVFHIVNEETRHPVESPAERVLREGIVVGLANHTVLLARDGREVPIEDSGAPIRNSLGRIDGVVLVFRDVSDRRARDRELADSEARHRLMFENNPQPMWVFERSTLRFLAVNQAAISLYGYSRERFLSSTVDALLLPGELAAFRDSIQSAVDRAPSTQVWHHLGHQQRPIEVETVTNPISFDGTDAILTSLTDITRRRALEEQLRQSQKLEAVGRLAGGVAHDFNNLLTVIIGYSDMIQLQLDPSDPTLPAITEISRAAERASSLTQQLLAFSRRQILQPQPLELNTIIRRIISMLARLLGEDVRVQVQLQEPLWVIAADPGQIDQIIMNLAVNSRDAMEQGGTLTIKTANEVLDPVQAQRLELEAGEYVVLTISDTGRGMDPDLVSRIFEPFFTTKEPGRGTGLGLSTVYGIVKQSGGAVEVNSEVGVGSTFQFYFPRAKTTPAHRHQDAAHPQNSSRRETILVVEDDESVRNLVRASLVQNGYSVLEARDADEAVRLCVDRNQRIDLMLSDLVLPGADGREIARQVTQLRPNLPVLFMSGYTEHAVLRRSALESTAPFLQKPFTPAVLAAKVREILDQQHDRTHDASA